MDDPFEFGAIAAANALSDVYAMGGTPFLALNIAAFPANLPVEVLGMILRGAGEKVREAGAVIVGGHTIKDVEPKFGLVAVGMVSTGEALTKAGFKPGDKLVLTKPIGSGILTTALKNGQLEPAHLREVVSWMSRLNGPASELARKHAVRGATDITGFGLLGHALEAADASLARLHFSYSSIPIYAGAQHHAVYGSIPGGSADNQLLFAERVKIDDAIDPAGRTLLYDAQTSGGLLLSVPGKQLPAFMRSAAAENMAAWIVGRVEEGQGVRVSRDAFD